ncbi:MAG: GGDEF domain-containing protein [Clostridia bacterium]|nr:GGDEF domain-containing protein [Clostridia bacterium]
MIPTVDILIGFLESKLPTLFLIAGLCMILHRRKKTINGNLHYLWIVVVSAGVLAIAEHWEKSINDRPDLVVMRIVLSIVGYCMRSQCVLGLLLAVTPSSRRRRRLWIPQFLLMTVMMGALLPTKLVFYYENNVDFARGPLGYVAFIVPYFYVACLLVQTARRFRDRSLREGWLLLMCTAFCILEMVVEVFWSGGNLDIMLMTSAVFLFVFIRFQDTDRDALTGLKNRSVYYEERDRFHDIVTAVAYVDLNGLKRINDTIGHDEGDRALTVVGDALQTVSGKDMRAYRVGGDEFILLFFTDREEIVKHVIELIKREVHRQGLSVAAGYAMRTAREPIHNLAQTADRNMYEDKAAYYHQRGYDRRK